MTHYIDVNDTNGDLIDLIPFCCASCRTDYCRDNSIETDENFSNAEGGDSNEYCAECGVIAHIGFEEESCEHQRDNFVVNRFQSEEGEVCEHGNWIQLPVHMLRKGS